MINIFKKEDSKTKFMKNVLRRYRNNTPTSDFVKTLFKNETKETLNERFKKIKRDI